MSDSIDNYITVAEYAKLHGRLPDSVKQKINRGTLPAKNIGGRWLVKKDEPYTDERVKSGKYKDWRKEK